MHLSLLSLSTPLSLKLTHSLRYITDRIALNWRTFLTEELLARYFHKATFFRMLQQRRRGDEGEDDENYDDDDESYEGNKENAEAKEDEGIAHDAAEGSSVAGARQGGERDDTAAAATAAAATAKRRATKCAASCFRGGASAE